MKMEFTSDKFVTLSDGKEYTLAEAIKKLDEDNSVRIYKNFCCYSAAMAQALEAQGFEIINVYTSKVNGKKVYQFAWTDSFNKAKDEYVNGYHRWKQENEISG